MSKSIGGRAKTRPCAARYADCALAKVKGIQSITEIRSVSESDEACFANCRCKEGVRGFAFLPTLGVTAFVARTLFKSAICYSVNVDSATRGHLIERLRRGNMDRIVSRIEIRKKRTVVACEELF